jgi:hypothetical protein
MNREVVEVEEERTPDRQDTTDGHNKGEGRGARTIGQQLTRYIKESTRPMAAAQIGDEALIRRRTTIYSFKDEQWFSRGDSDRGGGGERGRNSLLC